MYYTTTMTRKLTIALDFDGTVVAHAYPHVGRDIGAVSWLKHLQSHGCRIVLNTMRSGEHLRDAKEWFEIHGVVLYGIQKHPTQHTWTSSTKVHAHVYVDDLGLGAPLTTEVHGTKLERAVIDWDIAGPMLCGLAGIPVRGVE